MQSEKHISHTNAIYEGKQRYYCIARGSFIIVILLRIYKDHAKIHYKCTVLCSIVVVYSKLTKSILPIVLETKESSCLWGSGTVMYLMNYWRQVSVPQSSIQGLWFCLPLNVHYRWMSCGISIYWPYKLEQCSRILT